MAFRFGVSRRRRYPVLYAYGTTAKGVGLGALDVCSLRQPITAHLKACPELGSPRWKKG